MNEHDHYIIVACDGLWDEMTNDEVGKLTEDNLT